MKRFFKQTVFWKFVILSFVIALLAVSALLPLYENAVSLAKQNDMKEYQHVLQRNAGRLESIVELVWRMPEALSPYLHYTKTKLYKSGVITNQYYALLGQTQRVFALQCLSVELADYAFLYFGNSGMGASKTKIYPSLSGMFQNDLVYLGAEPAAVMKTVAAAPEYVSYIPAGEVFVSSSYSSGRYLTLLTRRAGDSVVVGMLLDEERLFEMFGINNLPADSIFYITDAAGQMILHKNGAGGTVPDAARQGTYRRDGRNYTVLQYSLDVIGGEIVLCLPDSYFLELNRPLLTLSVSCFVTALLIGFCLSLLVARFYYRPIKAIISLSPGYAPARGGENEYVYIRNLILRSGDEIRSLQDSIRRMDDALRVNLLMRLLHGSLETADDQQLALKLIPALGAPYRVAVIGTDTIPREELRLLLHQSIEEQLPGILKCQIDQGKTALLLGEAEPGDRSFREAYERIRASLLPHDISVSAGLSERLFGVDAAPQGYRHALHCYFRAAESLVEYGEVGLRPAPLADYERLRRLYNLVSMCEDEAVEALFDEIQDTLRLTARSDDIAQSFYAIRCVLESVAHSHDLDAGLCRLPAIRENSQPHTAFEALGGGAQRLMEAIRQKNSGLNLALKNKLLEYIEKNHSDCNLCALRIAEAMNISESYVYKLAKDCTGKSLNNYILERRMEKAMLLLKREYPVAQIAQMCGYNSINTFYRAFKGHCGMTPAKFKTTQTADGKSDGAAAVLTGVFVENE